MTLEVKLADSPGSRFGRYHVEICDGARGLTYEWWQSRSHAGAWCRGARDFLAGVKENPYISGIPDHKIGAGKRGFANAWRYGWRSARYATKQLPQRKTEEA